MKYLVTLLTFFAVTLSHSSLHAQITPNDTSKIIQIISGNTMRQNQIDSATTLNTLAGNAVVRQGNTTISGDSIAVNLTTGVAEVFGNVHINDADSVHTYAQYLKYLGKQRIAYLKRNVKLTDGKGTLTTNDLEYNLATGIAQYHNGGKVLNGKTILTSADAVYYSDTKDVYFKKFVHLTDPEYDIKADSLYYNTQFKEARFIAPTRIVTKDGGVINTSNGIYNLQTGNAFFYDQTGYADSLRSASGKNMAYDEVTGILQIEGNGKIVDSANKVIALGDLILLDKNKNSFLATKKPVMIFYKDTDSTYIAADTLFSGLRVYDKVSKKTKVVQDSSQRNISIDSVVTNKNSPQQDSIRYFLAFHNVRIFNDSIQAVSDSLFYSTEDSVFRLFQSPVVWNGKSQLSGDTMYLFTKNNKPDKLYVFNNALAINEDRENIYNQGGGRTLHAFFIEGKINYIRLKGSPAESIFYPKDADSAYVGMNRSSSDVIDVYFKNDEVIKILFVQDVNGVLYPMPQVPLDKKTLKGFDWQDRRRPKNYLELFE